MAIKDFSPQSRSVVVYVLAMTCYSYTLNSLFSRIGSISNSVIPEGVPLLWRHERHWLGYGLVSLVISPLIESLILMLAIEFFGIIRLHKLMCVILSAAVMCALHWRYWWAWGIAVAPLFLISAGAYLRWRPVSRRVGYLVLVSIHAAMNALFYFKGMLIG
jgi:hypothetical protein